MAQHNMWKDLDNGRLYNTETKPGPKGGTVTTEYYRLLELSCVLLEVPTKKLGTIGRILASGKWPTYDLLDLFNVRVHIADGLKPDENGRLIGKVELNARRVTSSWGTEENVHLNMTFLPAEAGAEPTTLMHICQGGIALSPRFDYDHHYGPDSKEGNVFLTAL